MFDRVYTGCTDGENDMTIASTILAQLGGNKFVAMTGAKNFVNGGNYLQFSIGRNSSKTNSVRVTLQANDTYVMHFFKISTRTLDCTMLDLRSDLYADQ